MHILGHISTIATAKLQVFFFTAAACRAKINRLMTGRIKIYTERCKGCGLCVAVCPKKSLVISKRSNKKGYFPVEQADSDCTACAACAVICPDAAIEVYLDDDIVDMETKAGKNTILVREKK